MIISTYLSQEGFEEQRRGVFYSKEINTLIEATADRGLWDVTVDRRTYTDIATKDIVVVVETIHSSVGTKRVIVLYNMQRDVITKKMTPIKEDV